MDNTTEGNNITNQSGVVPTWRISLLLLLGAVLGALIYWQTIRLPLIYDDLLHIRITKGLDFASVWLPTQDFGFYRPLTFVPLLIIKGLFGYYPSELLHGINIAQHGFNVALLMFLSWRLWRKPHWAIATGLLFALYPFSYQAIAVYGHNVHPATTGLLLLGLHAYLQAISKSKRRAFWWITTVVIFVLGLLSHESAILFGAFAALVHWNYMKQPPALSLSTIWRFLRSVTKQPWFYFLLAGAFYFIIYQFFPLSRAPQAAFTAETAGYKFLYTLQAVVYPIAWFGQWLGQDPLVVFAGVLIVIALTAWSDVTWKNRLPLILGWAWWLLAAMVIALPLSASYLLHGPRLLYLSSVGTSFLWPILLQPIWQASRASRWLWGLIIAFIALTSWLFIRDRLSAYISLTGPVNLVEEVMEARPDEEGVLMVNLPAWTAPVANTYPIGVELVAMMGPYLFVEELVSENLAVDHPSLAIKIPDFLSLPDYNYGIHEQSVEGLVTADWSPGGSQLFVTTFGETGPEGRHLGGLNPDKTNSKAIAFLGSYELLAAGAQQCNGSVHLTTTWRVRGLDRQELDLSPSTSLFVQLIAQDGHLISQADGPPLRLRPDLLHVPAGWIITDNRDLPVSDQQGKAIFLGAYDFASGERYLARDKDGNPLAYNAFAVPFGDCE